MSVKQYLKDSGTVASFVAKKMVCDDKGHFCFPNLIAYLPFILPVIAIEVFVDKQDRETFLRKAKENKLNENSR